MEFTIEGDFDANELRAALEQTVSSEDGAEFRLVRPHSQTRIVTGLEPAALLAILKGVTTLTPIVVAIVKWLLGKGKTEGKSKTIKIVAADDSILSVPGDTSPESLGALLDQHEKFKNPKLVVVE